jgi:hypothetical protein
MILNKTPFAFFGKQMAFFVYSEEQYKKEVKRKLKKGTSLYDLICTFVIAVND